MHLGPGQDVKRLPKWWLGAGLPRCPIGRVLYLPHSPTCDWVGVGSPLLFYSLPKYSPHDLPLPIFLPVSLSLFPFPLFSPFLNY